MYICGDTCPWSYHSRGVDLEWNWKVKSIFRTWTLIVATVVSHNDLFLTKFHKTVSNFSEVYSLMSQYRLVMLYICQGHMQATVMVSHNSTLTEILVCSSQFRGDKFMLTCHTRA